WLHLRGHLRAPAGTNAVTTDENIGMLHATAGKLHAHASAVLVNPLEIPTEVVARFVDGRAQKPLQAIPRREDLPQRAFVGDAALAIDGDTLGHLDTEILCPGAARFQGFQ